MNTSILNLSTKNSRIFAVQDVLQSLSGLILACFMLLHMIFTSTILFGKGAFESVVKFAEPFGVYQVTNFVAFIIFVIFILHAFLAMRKFPANFKAYKTYKEHKIRMKHVDTTLWWFQFLTGFLLFFFASAHLIAIIFGEKITAELSILRFENLHIFYFLLLIFTITHASIGMYRLIVKWISLGDNPVQSKLRRKKIRNVVLGIWFVFFIWSIIADIKWISLG